MTDSQTPARHGRRARRLTPEEEATQEQRAVVISGEMSAVPAMRGAVAAPTAEAPVPKLRKFGRRARIIELSEEPSPAADSPVTGAEPGSDRPAAGKPGAVPTTAGNSSVSTGPALSSTEVAQQATGDATTAGEQTPHATVPGPEPHPDPDRLVPPERDSDGVELGELPVTEAPDPKPAPRFTGDVLHRTERSGGRPLVWLVWALIAVALIVLITLLLTGIIGPGVADAAAAGLPAQLVDAPSPDTSPFDATAAQTPEVLPA